MSKEITFQELIDKIKKDLFYPYTGTDKEGKVIYPVFFVDNVELEITIELTYDAESGIKILIPQIMEGEIKGGQGKAKSHKMKINLSPILSRAERRELLEEDERLMQGIREASSLALRKGIELAGEEE